MTIGSVLCAAAPIWAVLLLGRALQGIGTAGVANVTMIILADSVSLKEQAVNISIFQLLQGIGWNIGPVIGGFIVDSDWRYSFVLCAGLGVVGMVCVFFLRSDLKPGSVSISHPANNQTRFEAFASGFSTLDFGGIFLFLFGIGLVILGTAWGGSTYAWNSPAVIISLVLGTILIILFVIYEKSLEPGFLLSRIFPNTIPLIPFSVLRSKDVGLICFMAAGAGAALYSVFYFISIYFILAEGYPASRAGINLLYYLPGIGVGVLSAIYLCNHKPRQTFWPLFLGTIIETGAMAALAYAVKQRQHTLVNVMMGVVGAGTGVRFMPFNLHLAGMFRDKLAPVYSLLRFAMPFGGTLALTVMGSVFQNQMAVYFGPGAGGSGNGDNGLNLHSQAALDAVSQLPPAQQEAVRARGAEATMWAFISILPFLGATVAASAGLGNVWISKREKATVVKEAAGEHDREEQREETVVTAGEAEKGEGQEKQERTHSDILTGIYLFALWQGRVRAQRKPGPTESGPAAEAMTRNSEADSGVELVPRSDP